MPAAASECGLSRRPRVRLPVPLRLRLGQLWWQPDSEPLTPSRSPGADSESAESDWSQADRDSDSDSGSESA